MQKCLKAIHQVYTSEIWPIDMNIGLFMVFIFAENSFSYFVFEKGILKCSFLVTFVAFSQSGHNCTNKFTFRYLEKLVALH